MAELVLVPPKLVTEYLMTEFNRQIVVAIAESRPFSAEAKSTSEE